MNTNTKIVTGVVGVVAVVIAFLLGKSLTNTILLPSNQSVGSAVGTTFSTARVAQVNITPSTGTATSSSILNSDDSDRIITDGFYSCSGMGSSQTAYTGAGLTSSGLILAAATSSSATPNASSFVLGSYALNVVVATTTVSDSYIATSTYTAVFTRRWAAGSYLNFFFNATNTAACTVGVHYLAS